MTNHRPPARTLLAVLALAGCAAQAPERAELRASLLGAHDDRCDGLDRDPGDRGADDDRCPEDDGGAPQDAAPPRGGVDAQAEDDGAVPPAPDGDIPGLVSPEDWFGESGYECCWRNPGAAALADAEECAHFCGPGEVATTRGLGTLCCVPDVGQCDPRWYAAEDDAP